MDHPEPSSDVIPLITSILPLNGFNGLMVARRHLILIEILRVFYLKRTELANRS